MLFGRKDNSLLAGEKQVTERDENGRFVKGQSGNPKGRPKKERSERYYEIAISACTYEDWRAVWKKAVEQAKRGNATARKFLADYLIGSPVRRTELSGRDGGPIETKTHVIGIDDGIAQIVALFDKARERARAGDPPADNE